MGSNKVRFIVRNMPFYRGFVSRRPYRVVDECVGRIVKSFPTRKEADAWAREANRDERA
jgi:hypothetical protein